MSEIEKMYENVGIKKVRQTNIAGGDYPIVVGYEAYPPFTAEKQLELIKWLGTTDYYTFGIYYHQGLWYIHTEATNRQNEKFDECLASLVNLLWQDLTEEERKQIKEILE